MEKDYYAEGYDAYYADIEESYNPYDPDDDGDAHLAWNDGWAAAADED